MRLHFATLFESTLSIHACFDCSPCKKAQEGGTTAQVTSYPILSGSLYTHNPSLSSRDARYTMNSEKYVYEPTKLDALPEHLLGKLTPESRGCIERLLAHDEPEPIE